MGADRFLDAVQSLVDEPIGAELLGVRADVAIAELRDGTFALVVSARLGAPDDLEALIRNFVGENSSTNLKIIAIGGDAEHRAVLARVQPSVMLGRVVQVFAVDDDGGVWAGARSRLDSPVGVALTAVGARAEPRSIDPTALAARVSVPTEAERATAEDARAFVETTRRGLPIATVVILGLIVVMFGLEWLWGGTEFVPTLVRMGANGSWALAGEPWRLLSCAWLHAGALHLLVNAYVLYSLGGFLERMFGASRFVVLYVAAALGGGLASAGLSDAALSVGASGAIWGVLGASVALAWRPAGLVPDAVLATFRRNAIVNVVINLAVSFLPSIDVMAHLGGGLVGAALVLSGVLTRGVSIQPRAHARVWCVAAVLAAVAMLTAPVIAITRARPWAIFAPGEVTHELGGGATIRLPAAMSVVEVAHDDGRTIVDAGDLLRDRGAMTVVFQPIGGELGFPEELDEAFAEYREAQTEPPEGGVRVGEREFTEGPRHRAFSERFHFTNGIDLIVIHQLHTTAKVRIEALYWASRDDVANELRAAADSLTIP